MCASFGDPRSRDRELRLKKNIYWKFTNSPITQKPLYLQNWNLDTMWVLMIALCKPSLGAPSHVTKILQTENLQK